MFYGLKIKLKSCLCRWAKEEQGLATVEAALVFPVMMTLLLGTFDMGNAILANQKTIRASQVAADLITRNRTVSNSEIDEAVDGSQLAFEPLDSDSFGIDVISIRFDEDAETEIVWRETRNMSPIDDVITRVESLSEENGGVVVVVVQYLFEPIFAGFVIDEVPMQEIAFARGRQSAVVNLE